MNNKLLKDLIRDLISDCEDQISELEIEIKIKDNSNNIEIIKKLKNNIDNIKDVSVEELKDILNDLDYEDYEERVDLERHLLKIRDSIGIELNSTQYEYIKEFYDKLDQYSEHYYKDDNETINELGERISMYYRLLNKLSLLNNELIDEVEVIDLVLKSGDFNYYIKKDILRNILKYNKELYLKNI